MTAFGYAFLLVGGLLIRQVIVGRAKDTPTDARDMALAFLGGDMQELSAVFARRGSSDGGSGTGSASAPVTSPFFMGSFAAEVQKLGNAAKGYKLGATGPDYYDCSGLIWAAMRNLGLYSGPRFTTYTFSAVARAKGWTVTPTPGIGDVILWPTHHMGICVGTDQMYSARSPEKGIGVSSISGDSTYFGTAPTYYRINNG